MIFKFFLAFCIGLGALYAAQQYWLQAMTTKVAETAPSRLIPSAAVPPIEIDPDKSRLAINPPVVLDTGKYGVPLPPRFR